jgi:single-stranded-DNA-specific exonuclease
VSEQAGSETAQARWIIKNPAMAAADCGGPDFAPVIDAILTNRDIVSGAQRQAFLEPRLADLSDPFEMPGMAAAVKRIFSAADRGEKVALYGDYDVDGVTSLTLLKAVLDAYNIVSGTFLPHRVGEGYGLSVDGLKRCLEEQVPGLLIAVDCGTTSIDEVQWLTKRGVETVILDHHEPAPDGLPDCIALVNPKVPEPETACRFDYLCSVGVVFKLAHAMLKERPVVGFNLRDYLDIVAVGTVADIVPLRDENRTLVKHGLCALARTHNAGLAALAEIAGINPPYGAQDISFRISPRLNAAGRLGSAAAALDLMLCENPGQARDLAGQLDKQNQRRQELEHKASASAIASIEAGQAGECLHGIVVADRDWHPGVVGIVASRIARKFHRPAFVIAIDENGVGKGSGRSIGTISLIDIIHSGHRHLLGGGGHEMAAGISIREEDIDAFRAHLNSHVRNTTTPEDMLPLLHIDTECRLEQLQLEILDHFMQLEPFGAANPEPLLIARNVSPTSEPRILKDKHYRFSLQQERVVRDAIYFNGVENGLPRPPWDVAFTIMRNDFRGRVSLQMNIRAIRQAER